MLNNHLSSPTFDVNVISFGLKEIVARLFCISFQLILFCCDMQFLQKKFYLLSIDISVLMVVAVVDKVRAACRCRSVVTARGKLYLSLRQFIVISASPLDLSRVTHLEAT